MTTGIPSSMLDIGTIFAWNRGALDDLAIQWEIKKDLQNSAVRNAILKRAEWDTFVALNSSPNTAAGIINEAPDKWEDVYSRAQDTVWLAQMVEKDNSLVAQGLERIAVKELTSSAQIDYVLKSLPLEQAQEDYSAAVQEIAPYLDNPIEAVKDHADAVSLMLRMQPKITALMDYLSETARVPRATAVIDAPDLFVLEQKSGMSGPDARLNYTQEDFNLHSRVKTASNLSLIHI